MKKSIAAANADAYVASLEGWRKAYVEAIRTAVLEAAPVLETVKWGHLVFLSNGPAFLVRAEDNRVLFGFWRGRRLRDIEPRLKPGGKYEMANPRIGARHHVGTVDGHWLGQSGGCTQRLARRSDGLAVQDIRRLTHAAHHLQPKESSMKAFVLACLVVFSALQASPARAESLRCNGYSASEGDSRISVLYKCGPPQLRDNYCSTVYYSQTLQPVPDPFASIYVPCQQVEEWLYERGPGQLPATVRFRGGVVQSIRYGRDPQ